MTPVYGTQGVDAVPMLELHQGRSVAAAPMTRAEYELMRGWEPPAWGGGDDEGYLVEYQDCGKPNHAGFDGYITWSTKEQFEKFFVRKGVEHQ